MGDSLVTAAIGAVGVLVGAWVGAWLNRGYQQKLLNQQLDFQRQLQKDAQEHQKKMQEEATKFIEQELGRFHHAMNILDQVVRNAGDSVATAIQRQPQAHPDQKDHSP